ncbi:LDCC motif putative metal-binding protein [Proteinivorax tanatarense]|uniref:LDCC motif putative metal-binding protein n=1 Tax=Proteinivorax tanatarense TaxID=1260629 RepID=A0AAU7VP03_9FIRM
MFSIFAWLKKLLNFIAKENEKEMGNKGLDCCELNQDKKKRRK